MRELGNSKARKVAIGAAVGIAIGSIGPWADTFLGSVAGTQGGDGKMTLVIAIGVGFVAFLTKTASRRAWLLIAAVLASLLAAYAAIHDLVNLETGTQEIFGRQVDLVSAGWGIWVTAIASLVALVATALYWREVIAAAREPIPDAPAMPADREAAGPDGVPIGRDAIASSREPPEAPGAENR
jgi:hypothetical protein